MSFPPPVPLPTAPPSRSRALSRKAIGWIIAGSAVGLLILVMGAVAVVAYITLEVIGPKVRTAPETGKEATPLAAKPLDCDGECFGYFAHSVPFPSTAELEALGLTEDEGDIYADDSVSNVFADSKRAWEESGGTPGACFVTYPSAPIAPATAPDVDLTRNSITFDGSHSNVKETSTFSQSERLFESSEAAVEYMVLMEVALGACSAYELDGGTATVTRPPALDLPDSVAAVGWVESWDGGRYYVYDLQRGNYVVRTTLSTDGLITEKQFRDLMTLTAERLGDMRHE